MTAHTSPRVIVGMSGGVDSSVAALLLLKQGYRVEGLFMKNWEEDDTAEYCSASADVADAQSVCDQLGIRLHTINFSAEYWDRVFSHFLAEYRAGRTPNPDILCNKEIKFKAFLDYALQQGADFIATGHYAKRLTKDHTHYLLRACDLNKDQSYFLYTLGQQALSHTLFPVGDYTKPAIREMAAKAGFKTATKKDSTGICFIGERKFTTFLNRYLPAQPGRMETLEGEYIGEHQGLMYYTLGQRQGLHIGGRKEATEAPWYVLKKDISRNVLIVGQGHDHPALFSRSLRCTQTHWVQETPPAMPLQCSAKTRYRQLDEACTVISHDTEGYRITFDRPQWAVTPGQSIVFYQDTHCLGGGIIEEIYT